MYKVNSVVFCQISRCYMHCLVSMFTGVITLFTHKRQLHSVTRRAYEELGLQLVSYSWQFQGSPHDGIKLQTIYTTCTIAILLILTCITKDVLCKPYSEGYMQAQLILRPNLFSQTDLSHDEKKMTYCIIAFIYWVRVMFFYRQKTSLAATVLVFKCHCPK